MSAAQRKGILIMRNISAILLAAVLASAGSAMAGDFDGPYVGGNIGVNSSSTGGTYTTSSANAPWYSLEGGYGWNLGGNVLLGLQGRVGGFGTTAHAPAGEYGGKAYGLGLKVGVPIDSLMPYAWLGYDHTQGMGSLSGFSADSANSGVGLMYKFAPSWSLEGEFSSSVPSSGGIRLKSNSVNFGLNYYFDAAPAAPSRR